MLDSTRTPNPPPRGRFIRSLHRRPRRGFTLVELLAAMSAGALVALAALILARNASRFFQYEARISAAQLAVSLGMNRLTSDLQRASFLASPTHRNGADPKLCPPSGVPTPPAIASWTGLAIRVEGSVASHPADLKQGATPENNLFPDSIVLGGSFATTERFTIEEISLDGRQVRLRTANDEAMARLRTTAARSGQPLESALAAIFVPGRFLRVLDDNGNAAYGIIADLTPPAAPTDPVIVNLTSASPLPRRVANATCGFSGFGKGLLASVVYRVLYDIRSLKDNKVYENIVHVDPVTARVSGEDSRTELVRVELDENGLEKPTTLELIAEFAVDLKFAVTKASTGVNPTVRTVGFGDAEVEQDPELIRALQVRLATRTRVPDRDVALSAGAQPYRFAVMPGTLTPRFARIRTLNSTISLPNQSGFTTP